MQVSDYISMVVVCSPTECVYFTMQEMYEGLNIWQLWCSGTGLTLKAIVVGSIPTSKQCLSVASSIHPAICGRHDEAIKKCMKVKRHYTHFYKLVSP